MAQYPACNGDTFLLYAGTMHYSPGGLLFYEIMQNSDVYTSLSRPDPKLPEEQRRAKVQQAVRAVHLEEDYDCRTRPVTLPGQGENTRRFLCACRHFALERLELAGPEAIICDGSKFLVLTAIEGVTRLAHGRQEETLLPGHSVLLPACLGRVMLLPQANSALLKAYVPDLAADVIAPLRQAGIADADIAALGGRTRLNDLASLL
jgi:mannose-6-phosphate isomerase